MNASDLKRYIYDNNKIITILEALDCHNIKSHSGETYYTCGMPDGDNPKSTVIYNDEYLGVNAYTRNIKDKFGNSDIISLVSFIIKEDNFSKNLKWICDCIGLDYYSDDFEDIPDSIKWTRWMMKVANNELEDEKEYLKPIPEKVLTYYKPYLSKMFYEDGIPHEIQQEFEVGYDLATHRIVIPIRDELGTLVGVKGRAMLDSQEDKYIYLEPCAKTHILYGLYNNYDDIKKQNQVVVVESEKSVMKLMAYGVFNAVAIGGHQLSRMQVEKLTRLNVDEIVICYDEDVCRDKNGKISKKEYMDEVSKFIPQQNISLMVDINGEILQSKESPADNRDKFLKMYEDRIKIKRESE